MKRALLAALFLVAACKTKPQEKPEEAKTPPPPPPSPVVQAAPSKCEYAAYYEWAADGTRSRESEISGAEIQKCSLRELALLRNEIFARAGNVFRKKWLRDHFSAFPWYRPTELDPKKLTPIDVKNAATVASAEVAIPADELQDRMTDYSIEWKKLEPSAERERIELEISLLSTALGKASEIEAEEQLSPLEDPTRLDKLLTVDELADFSPRDLRILRNTIYARRGRPFKSPILREYFSRMEWYEADPKYSDARLTKIDGQNIKIISSVEKELGGPIGDADHADMDQCA